MQIKIFKTFIFVKFCVWSLEVLFLNAFFFFFFLGGGGGVLTSDWNELMLKKKKNKQK